MQKSVKISSLRWITIWALLLFALSVVIQMAMGRTEYPPIPSAIIITVGAALCLAFARTQKWSGVAAFLVPLSLFVGVTINKWYIKLAEPTTAGYPGIVLQWVTLIVALIGTGWLLYAEYFKKNKRFSRRDGGT